MTQILWFNMQGLNKEFELYHAASSRFGYRGVVQSAKPWVRSSQAPNHRNNVPLKSFKEVFWKQDGDSRVDEALPRLHDVLGLVHAGIQSTCSTMNLLPLGFHRFASSSLATYLNHTFYTYQYNTGPAFVIGKSLEQTQHKPHPTANCSSFVSHASLLPLPRHFLPCPFPILPSSIHHLGSYLRPKYVQETQRQAQRR